MWNTKVCLVLVCSYFIFAQNASAAVVQKDEGKDLKPLYEQKCLNRLFDFFLGQFAALAKSEKLDPLSIPDASAKFQQKVFLTTFKAGASLKFGKIVGVSSLYRTGNCILNKGETNSTVTTDLGVKAMKIAFRGEAYTFPASVKYGVDINAKVKNLRIRAVVAQGNELTSKAKLLEFAIKSMDFDIDFSGLFGPLAWIVTLLEEFLKKIFKTRVTALISVKVRDLIASKIQNYHLPFGF